MRLLAVPLALLCALLVSSCGNTLQVQPIPHDVLEGLVVAPFPVYWLGATFKGLAVSEASHDPSDAYTVSYGNCLQGGQGYCVQPLRIVTSPDNTFLPGDVGAGREAHIRGVIASLYEHGRTVVLPAGGVVIDIYADSEDLALATARALAPINTAGVPGGALPAPVLDPGFDREPLPTQVPDPLRPLAPLSSG